ncbi:type I DNA topoisomerase [bacterium]|nr:MAG: type I DNA topoisomerase [bacterium]
MKSLVIVESPTKAKTIKKFLPKGFLVDSSMGHIRDLPANAKEIPAKYKKEKWANIGINIDKNYEPLYVISSDKKKVVDRLKKQLGEVDELILATDEDREGEGISWHLLEVLKPKIPVKRMVFHEITESAIKDALENFREIDINLVNAQETRRIMDRLVGYTISPLLWKKLAPNLSAGRVQSVAVEVMVQRERERMRFVSSSYWDIIAQVQKNGEKSTFKAELHRVNSERIANGKDFNAETGELDKKGGVRILNEDQAKALIEEIKTGDWQVISLEQTNQKRSPAPPFITSTLQQEANRKYGFSAKETMQIAQRLYESGYITYMRTDSTNLSSQAIQAARDAVVSIYGDEYLYKSVRSYSKKAKGAQEAHEAIRPAGTHFRTPQETGLANKEFKLYDLIWKRTMATQMADAVLNFTNIEIEAKTVKTSAVFKASGKQIVFPGFFRAYVEGSDDPEAALEDQESMLPQLLVGEKVTAKKVEPKGHETKPPARFTEATLVKALEKEGVGRPSTYASIISTVIDRGYVQKDGNALVPTFMAFAVTGLLEKHFPDLVDLQFTSDMEGKLDEIASGEQEMLNYLDGYFKGQKGLLQQIEMQETQIDPQDARKIDLPIHGLNDIQVLVGRYGPYVQKAGGTEAASTSLPVDLFPGDITPQKLEELLKDAKEGPSSLGKDPVSKLDIYVLNGRFGPYVQLGLGDDSKEKPKRASLLKGMKPEDLDLPTALKLLEMPRLLGNHPETGKEIRVGIGRFGPYVVHDGTFASLGKEDHVLEIELPRGLELLELANAKKSRGAGPIQELGKYPDEKGDEIQVLTGRFGPYIKWGKTNVKITKGFSPETITRDEAIELIKAKTK